MKKVCCITPINTPNYGTVLQAFALQEAVENRLGHEYVVLNYYSREQERKFSFWGTTKYMNSKYKIAKKVLYPLRKYQMTKILDYQNVFTHMSERIETKEELKSLKDVYDVFLVGSDQVWNNQEINHYDDAFFLAFAKDKLKIAYAASFGKTYSMLTKEDIAFYKKNLPLMDYISVREKTGVKIVKNIINGNAQWVCDPVYLLDEKQWLMYSENPKFDNYILVYLVGDGINFDVNNKIVKIAKALGKAKQKKVVVVGIGLSSVLYGAFKTPTVQQWLGLIKNADLIMTNAFHGTAFATIFEKNFISFVSGNADNRMNTRLYDLLSFLELETRLFSIEESIAMVDGDINYTDVKKRIQLFREESYDFLKKAITSHETGKYGGGGK